MANQNKRMEDFTLWFK